MLDDTFESLSFTLEEQRKFLDRQIYVNKIEGRCIAIAVSGIVVLLFLSFVLGMPLLISVAGLWLACWFCGNALWGYWYLFRKGKPHA